jgi:hypothetical protein
MVQQWTVLVDAAGRRRSAVRQCRGISPGGPHNKGMQYPPARHEPSPVVVVNRHGGSEPDRCDEQSDEHWLDREELDVHGLSCVGVRLTIEPASATRGRQVRRHGREGVSAEAMQVPPRSPHCDSPFHAPFRRSTVAS